MWDDVGWISCQKACLVWICGQMLANVSTFEQFEQLEPMISGRIAPATLPQPPKVPSLVTGLAA